MKYLPHLLIATGLFILFFSLWQIWRLSRGLPERPHYVQRHPVVYIHDGGRPNGRTYPSYSK